jgi:hypothetical protein
VLIRCGTRITINIDQSPAIKTRKCTLFSRKQRFLKMKEIPDCRNKVVISIQKNMVTSKLKKTTIEKEPSK